MPVTDVEGVSVAGWPQRIGQRPILLAVIGAVCVSASGVLIELAASAAATTAFFRCAFALPFLIPLALHEQGRLGARPRNVRLRLAVPAGMLYAINLVLYTHAVEEVGAGIATVLSNLQVVFIAAAAWMAFGERPSRRFAVLLPVLFAGVLLVSGLAGRPAFGGHPVEGIAFGVGTSLGYAAFLLILRGATATHVAGPLMDVTACAAVSSLILGGIFGTLDLTPSWRTLGWLLLLAVTNQTVGWLFITSSLARLPRAISSLVLLLQPVAALGLAALVLSERPALGQLVGAVLICGSVLAISRRTAIDKAAM